MLIQISVGQFALWTGWGKNTAYPKGSLGEPERKLEATAVTAGSVAEPHAPPRGSYVDLIPRDTASADLPIELPTISSNLTTAKALDLAIRETILNLADGLIE